MLLQEMIYRFTVILRVTHGRPAARIKVKKGCCALLICRAATRGSSQVKCYKQRDCAFAGLNSLWLLTASHNESKSQNSAFTGISGSFSLSRALNSTFFSFHVVFSVSPPALSICEVLFNFNFEKCCKIIVCFYMNKHQSGSRYCGCSLVLSL